MACKCVEYISKPFPEDRVVDNGASNGDTLFPGNSTVTCDATSWNRVGWIDLREDVPYPVGLLPAVQDFLIRVFERQVFVLVLQKYVEKYGIVERRGVYLLKTSHSNEASFSC